MKDIDFDELDKAVSSLIGPSVPPRTDDIVAIEPKKSEANTPAQEPKLERVIISQPEKPKIEATKPEPALINTPDPQEKPTEESSDARTIPVSPRVMPHRSGRFMDMVHTAETSVKDSPVNFPSKSGRTLQPSQETVKARPATDTKPSQNDSSTTVVTPANSTEPVWPDPLTVQKVEDIMPKAPAKSDDEQDLKMDPLKDWDMDGTFVSSTTPSTPVSPETPFLSDAKVEKRPLGAFSPKQELDESNDTDGYLPDTDKKDVVEHNDIADNHEETKAKEPHATLLLDDGAEPEEEMPVVVKKTDDEPLPRELEKDILAIESDEGPHAQHDFMQRSNTEPKKPGHGNSAMTADGVVSAATAMSIPKQYKEGAEAAENGGHSLFDTEEYHPPLNKHADPHNHKYAVLWIILALLFLIATAAGFGYWLYLQI